MKRILVAGAGGFIGGAMVQRLKRDGHFVRGLGRGPVPDSPADEYWTCDLREPQMQFFEGIDEVYQFACEVGGLGYIHGRCTDVEMLRNSTRIDLNILEMCRQAKVQRVFFASSACVYPNYDLHLSETDAYPADPPNEFGWQKLFAERLYRAYARDYGLDVRIGRLFNCYGPGMPFQGGREKVIGALCRKVAQAQDGGEIEIWGDGLQTRSFLFIDDAVEGIKRLMKSDVTMPLNIGHQSAYSIKILAALIAQAAGKTIRMNFVEGPVGSSAIVCDARTARARLGWTAKTDLASGLRATYPWIEKQVLDASQKTA